MVVVFTGGGADTDPIAPYLFRALRSDIAIAENPANQRRLDHALRRSSEPIPVPRNIKTPKLASLISGLTYSLSPNPLDLRSLRFDFRKRNEAAAALQFDAATWMVPVGLDGRCRFAPAGTYGLAVAAQGRWLSDSEFLLDLDTIANVNHFVFNIRFDNERAHIRMNEVTGEMKDVTAEGVAQKRSN
jgi:hypothetical protein